MNAHVPDLERCKRLKEKGFPQETPFGYYSYKVWPNERPELLHRREAFQLHYKICAAPIVTELVEEIVKIAPRHKRVSNLLDITVLDDGRFLVDTFVSPIHGPADTLPNALADLWLWLRKEGR